MNRPVVEWSGLYSTAVISIPDLGFKLLGEWPEVVIACELTWTEWANTLNLAKGQSNMATHEWPCGHELDELGDGGFDLADHFNHK